MKRNQDHLNILRNISKNSNANQRQLAKSLGFSLGKLNYCINALKNKGLIKMKNFKKNPKKLNYFYVLTPKGISEKTKFSIQGFRRSWNTLPTSATVRSGLSFTARPKGVETSPARNSSTLSVPSSTRPALTSFQMDMKASPK